MKTTDCNLCREIKKDTAGLMNEEYKALIDSGKNLVLETENFVVMPSFGPLNRSHVMVVPRKHINSIALMEEKERGEAVFLLNKLSEIYFNNFDISLVFFESGAGKLTSHSGGCITHAHIHCVEESIDFERRVFEEINLEEVSSKECASFDADHGYVWYRDSVGNEFYRNCPLLPSQFLRYLYLQCTDRKTTWNWRRDIDMPGMINVIEAYRDVKSKGNPHQSQSGTDPN